MTTRVIVLSKCLIVLFVTTVTLWYFVTPYIVQPHQGIIKDLLTKADLQGVPPAILPPSSNKNLKSTVRVENWTKWRLYLRNSDKVIHGGTSDLISINDSKAVMFMEWRPEYEIIVSAASDDSVEAQIQAPLFSFQKWGIYNHLVTELVYSNDDVTEVHTTVRIVPRFLFGIPIKTVSHMYSGGDGNKVPMTSSVDDDVTSLSSSLELLSKLPIIGVFSQSTRYDRVIIQAYMNLVTLSVIFLLWANNPPESLLKPSSAAAAASPSTAASAAADNAAASKVVAEATTAAITTSGGEDGSDGS